MKQTGRISMIAILALLIYSCETDDPEKTYTQLSGIYSCEESSSYSGYKKYIVEIDKVQSQDNVFIISNFHNQGYGEFLYASRNGDSIFIENQVISTLFVNGKGVINEAMNRIELLYTTDDGKLEIEYFGVYSR